MNSKLIDEYEEFKRNKQEQDEYDLYVMIEEYKQLTPQQKLIYNKLIQETS
jgi:hypothetical protein